MKSKISHLFIATLLFAGEPSLHGRAQPGQHQQTERNWKLTPHDPTPEPTNERERARRHARGAMFDDPTHTKRRLDMRDPEEGRTSYGSSAGFPLRISPLPVADSDTVVIGEVVSFQPYFSNDKTSIYHELTIRIEQILKDNSSIAKENGSIVIIGGGGALRLPNGKVAQQFVPPPVENDIRVGERYVLFLLYRREAEAFLVWKPWGLRTGHAIPMARSDIRDAEIGSSPYAGMSEAAFLNEVRDSVANSPKPQ